MFHNLFTGIFDSSTTTVISVPEFLLCVGVSLVIGVILAAAYAYKTRYNPGFVRTLAILPAVVCVVIMMVNGNVGTGVAVAGAFSLVRFRSAPGSAKDIHPLPNAEDLVGAPAKRPGRRVHPPGEVQDAPADIVRGDGDKRLAPHVVEADVRVAGLESGRQVARAVGHGCQLLRRRRAPPPAVDRRPHPFRTAAEVLKPVRRRGVAGPRRHAPVHQQRAEVPRPLLHPRQRGGFGAPQYHPFGLLSGQRLFGPLADKISLNLCRKAESKSQHLARNILTKPVIVLDGPDTALFRHTDIENLHNHKKIAPQPGQLGTDNQIVFLHPVQEFS